MKSRPKCVKPRAEELADFLCNHTEWRTHGRSLKIEDLQDKLEIGVIDKDPVLADIVYRIKKVVRMIFNGSTIYKLFFLSDFRFAKTFSVSAGNIPSPNPVGHQKMYDGIEVVIRCPKCGTNHKVMGYLGISSDDISKAGLKTNPNVNGNDILICSNSGCSFEIDLKPIKSQIETQTKKTVAFK